MTQGSVAAAGPKLEEVIAATEEIYVCSRPWAREQRPGQTIQEGKKPESALEFDERLPNALEACADRMDQHQRQIAHQDQTPLDILIANAESGARKSADSLEELLSAVTELQVLVSARKR